MKLHGADYQGGIEHFSHLNMVIKKYSEFLKNMQSINIMLYIYILWPCEPVSDGRDLWLG